MCCPKHQHLIYIYIYILSRCPFYPPLTPPFELFSSDHRFSLAWPLISSHRWEKTDTRDRGIGALPDPWLKQRSRSKDSSGAILQPLFFIFIFTGCYILSVRLFFSLPRLYFLFGKHSIILFFPFVVLLFGSSNSC